MCTEHLQPSITKLSVVVDFSLPTDLHTNIDRIHINLPFFDILSQLALLPLQTSEQVTKSTTNQNDEHGQARTHRHRRCCMQTGRRSVVIGVALGHDQSSQDWTWKDSTRQVGRRCLPSPRS